MAFFRYNNNNLCYKNIFDYKKLNFMVLENKLKNKEKWIYLN